MELGRGEEKKFSRGEKLCPGGGGRFSSSSCTAASSAPIFTVFLSLISFSVRRTHEKGTMRKLGFLFFEGEEEKSLGRENQAPIAAVEVLYFLFLFPCWVH